MGLCFRWALAASFVAVAACGADGGNPPDGGDASVPVGTLEVVGDGSLTLSPRDEVEVAFRYRDVAGRVVQGMHVSFALLGNAHDSTLGQIDDMTDAAGMAGTTLTGGQTRAVFRLRGAADDGALAFVDVAVSADGFGAIELTTSYAGSREPAAVELTIFNGTICDALPPSWMAADRMVQLLAPPATATLDDLAAGTTYALVALGVDAMRHPLVRGCIDGVAVAPGDTTDVQLSLQDLPADPTGAYEGVIDLDATTIAARLSSVATTAGDAWLAPPYSEEARIVDATIAELRALGQTGTADQLVALRTGGQLEPTVSAALTTAGGGLGGVVDLFTTTLARDLQTLQVDGLVVADFTTVFDPPITWSITGMRALGNDVPVSIDPMALGADVDVRGAWDAARGRIAIQVLELRLPSDALFEAWASAQAARDARADADAWWLSAVNCAAYGAAIGSTPLLAICDAACLEAGCRRATRDVVAALAGAMLTLEPSRRKVTLSGDLDIAYDGMLAVESIAGSALIGLWSGPEATDDGDLVTGTATLTPAIISVPVTP